MGLLSKMGTAPSKIDDDKALLLCRQRKHFVRQALDGRYALAAAHVLYIQALRKTGMALGKFVEPEVPVESSLYTSTSASGTPEPLALTDKSASQFSNSSPSLSQHVETTESFSPSPSPPNSDRFRMNYMKSSRNYSTVIEERPPITVTSTLQPSASSKASARGSETLHFDAPPPPPGTPPWDYFNLFENDFSFHEGRSLSHTLDNADVVKRYREEEGIPELEEEGDKSSMNGKSEYSESEDEFENPSTEPLVRIFKNRNEELEPQSTNDSLHVPSVKNIAAIDTKESLEKPLLTEEVHKLREIPDLTPPKLATPLSRPSVNEKTEEEKAFVPESKITAKDFRSCIKEIEELFTKASDSGKEVHRMLEANKVSCRLLLPEDKAHKAKRSTFFSSFFVCCKETAFHYEEPTSVEVKYLTWHRSISSHSSSSRNLLGATSRDDVGDMSNNLFGGICMNSGSHSSTLDRLYAWERKLYDEVKASGIVRKEYDIKCKLLRHQESRAENTMKIDKTRAKVKDLYSRIIVAIERIDSISKTIEELRDKELQPQLEELIGGLSQMWTTMLDCHKRQFSVISMAYINESFKISLQSESNRQAALGLEYELNFLCSSFKKWIQAHKSYLQAINDWLLKCVIPVKQKSMRRQRTEFCPHRDVAPPIYVTCRDWLAGLDLLEKSPAKEVHDALKDLMAEIAHFFPHQDKDHGSLKLSFSLSQKIGRSGELTENILHNVAPMSWSLGLDDLQSRLEIFLDRLKSFSEQSVKMYADLKSSIVSVRTLYDNFVRKT